MIELQHENKLAEMRELLYDLQDKNQLIELEKLQLTKMKDKQIKELSGQVKQLEQQLIDANLEIANVRTKFSLEQQLVAKIKAQMEKQDQEISERQASDMNFDQPYGADMPDLESNRKKGKNNFLKMFRFDKARTPKNGG